MNFIVPAISPLMAKRNNYVRFVMNLNKIQEILEFGDWDNLTEQHLIDAGFEKKEMEEGYYYVYELSTDKYEDLALLGSKEYGKWQCQLHPYSKKYTSIAEVLFAIEVING